jgi:hypothetical protein
LPSRSFILFSRLPLRLLDDLLFFGASIIACCLSDRLPCCRHLLIRPPSLAASSPAASPIDSQPPSPANTSSLSRSVSVLYCISSAARLHDRAVDANCCGIERHMVAFVPPGSLHAMDDMWRTRHSY